MTFPSTPRPARRGEPGLLGRGRRLAIAAAGAALALAVTHGPATSAQAPAARPSPSPWDAFVADHLEAWFQANPDAAVRAGRHEFDGRIPDYSPDAIAAEVRRLKAARNRALAFTPAQLDERQRFERDYVVARIDGELFWLETAEWPFRNPVYYADAFDPDPYVSREYAPPAERLRAYIRFARGVPKALAQVRRNLRTPMPRPWLRIGRTTIGGLAEFYAKDVPGIFASVKDPALQAELKAANGPAVEAVRNFDAWLASEEPRANDAFALGPTMFSAMVKATEAVDVPLAELDQVGRRDLERNLAALREACASFAPNATVAACVERAHAHKAAGGDPVDAARQQLQKLREFVEAKGLVTIPGPEQALVKQAPAYKAWNFAYINIPGPYEKGLPSVYYIAPADPSWPKEKQDAYVPGEAELTFTSVHEVWPGHFLQFLHSNRAGSRFGQLFVGYAFAEGWAHYAEEMMWDAGLGDGNPEAHIGQLLEALLRNVRFVSAVGLHTKGMTVAESERMFREQGFQDAGNAEQQANRGTFDPAYLNYTMGKLLIRKLRDDWTATRGGRKAWREFHDQLLSHGGPPIPLLRKAMLPGHTGSLF
jgi:hypothetical protein